jgi:UDP-N-acetylmuramoyl-L-alanyl-D-glutamate--2,6-diaminopimelate ligase
MFLKRLINGWNDIFSVGTMDLDIKGIAYDSHDVKEDYIFVCIKGEKSDGHNYIDEAIGSGASCIVVSDRSYMPKNPKDITYLFAEDTRLFLSLISSNFYDNPSSKLKTIAITGTNGKTTTVFMVSSILHVCGFNHSVITTVQNKLLDDVLPPYNTTPPSLAVQEILAKTVEKGGTHCIIESSSHGIEMKRLSHVQLDYIGFTNLTHDHIDKHGSIENYFNIKRSLIKNLKDEDGWLVAVNNDDEYISTITNNTLPYGIDELSPIMAKDIVLEKNHSSFTLITPEKNVPIRLSTTGLHNIYNALTAASVTYVDGITVEKIKEGLENFINVDGRMDIIDNNLGINIIVDFAHNPGALETMLSTAKSIYGGNIISVFGMGLYKDSQKYNLMGEIANKYCKMSIITTDSAEDFDPYPIAKKVSEGIEKNKYIIELDRYKAIKLGLSHCRPGDTLMVLGKGHEDYIKINGQKIPFKDSMVVKELALSMERDKNTK